MSPRGPGTQLPFPTPAGSLCLSPQVGSGGVDLVGVLEPLFQLLRPGRLGAQPALHPVSRGAQGPASPRPQHRLPACPRSPAVPFNPADPGGMQAWLAGGGGWAESGQASWGDGVPGGPDHPHVSRPALPQASRGRSVLGGLPRVPALPVACKLRPPPRPLPGIPRCSQFAGHTAPASRCPRRTAPPGLCPSETYSALCTTASLCWAPTRPTSGCPSTAVSAGRDV